MAPFFIEVKRENPVISFAVAGMNRLALFLNILAHCLRTSIANRTDKITI